MSKLIFFTLFCALIAGAADKRPNILFIFSDDHALRTISAYGGGVNETPNIDSLAKDGAIFTNSFCTNSICCPSRATILTGKHSHANGVRDNGDRFDNQQTQFPRIMGKNGYQTALIGKWHLNGTPGDAFDHWMILSGAGGQGHYYNPEFQTQTGTKKTEGYSTDVIADASMDWLKKRDKDKPFMLMCQFKAPHVHRIPAPRFMDLYRDRDLPEPATLFDTYENRHDYAKKAWMQIGGMQDHILNIAPPKGEVDMTDHRFKFLAGMNEAQRNAWHSAYDPQNEEYRRLVASGKLTGKAKVKYQYQRFIKDYVGCVAAIDDNVGRLLKMLEAEGLADNTIVIYSSDQGYYTGEHGWAEKRFMYEESVKMPFLIRWPGVLKPGQTIDAMIQNMDYGPTFLDAAGIPVPKEMHGRSLVPVLKGNTPKDWRDTVYYAYYAHGKHNVPRHDGIRNDRFKLIHFYTEGNWELFDLKADPNELKSLHANPEYASIMKDLKSQLADTRTGFKVPDYKDLIPPPKPPRKKRPRK